VQALLHRLGLHARKRLGQHFLVDQRVLARVVAAARLEPDDRVVEVGPGLGMLTRALARRAGQVVAIEVDPGLAAALGEMLAACPNVRVINADVLKVDPASVVTPPYKVVANLPYYITAPVLRHFLEASVRPQRMVVMVQREVAHKLVAGAGDLGILGISVQFYSRPTLVATVGPRSFYPPPKVESAIVALEVLPRPALEVEPARFFSVVRAGFAAPRKQLRNSLAQGLGLDTGEVARLLAAAGLDPHRRPQTLTLEEWGRLCQAVPSNEATPRGKLAEATG